MLRSQSRFDPDEAQSDEDESENVVSESASDSDNIMKEDEKEPVELPQMPHIDETDVTSAKRKVAENDHPDDPKYSSILAKYKALAASISLSTDVAPPIPLPRPEPDKSHKQETAIQGDLAHPIPQPRPAQKRKTDSKQIPDWIAEPRFIDPSLEASFESLGVEAKFLENLKIKQFRTAFAVQAAVIPALLSNQSLYSPDRRPDILVNAPTGSGKTLAYAIPIVQQISTIQKASKVSALILLPTAPLVRQVREVFNLVVKGTGVSVLALHGGRNFMEETEIFRTRCPNILVTTPGRLVDHLARGSPDLVRTLDFLVIDEADRLLNQSFQGWAEKMLSSLEPKVDKRNHYGCIYRRFCQKLIFSATLTRDPGHLAQLQIFDPRIFVVGSDHSLHDNVQLTAYAIPPTLKEYLVKASSPEDKPLCLIQLMMDRKLKSGILIFANSNESAARLARLVSLINENTSQKSSYSIQVCSGQIDRAKRAKIFSHFSKGLVDVLVCTDIMARGIDADNISDVINYDLPLSARDYVHRVGRTARAGKTGSAWTFITTKGEHEWFKKLVDDISRGINQVETVEISESDINEGLRSGYQPALNELKATVLSAAKSKYAKSH